MKTYHKINSSVYSIIDSYSILDDGAIQAKYVIGAGSDDNSGVTDFKVLTSEYKYIDKERSAAILTTELTELDLGKAPSQIILDRIYDNLINYGDIIV